MALSSLGGGFDAIKAKSVMRIGTISMLSFIIPVYKTPQQLLRNCLDSVLKYSQPMELICVLDSPGDPCEAVLDEYAAKEPRMRLLKNDCNRGVSYSRNRGLDTATGEYVAFVDADDVVMAEGYARGVQLAQAEHLDGCAISGSKNRHKRFNVKYGEHVIGTIRGTNALVLARAFFWVVYPHVFRRQLFAEHGIRFCVGHRFGEDFMMVVQLLCAGDRFAFLNQYAYLGVGHPESTCQSRPSPEKFLHMLIAVKTVLADIVAAGVGKEVLRWYVTIIIPLVLFDTQTRRFVVGENRRQYVMVLREFLSLVRNEYGGFLTLPFRCVVDIVIRFPCAWFLPMMPFSCVMRLLCHFGIMIKPLRVHDYE